MYPVSFLPFFLVGTVFLYYNERGLKFIIRKGGCFMYFGTIASGSSGNCLYVGTETTHLLVDAGVSCKKILEGLKSFGVDGKDIQAILVTHEHSDHISGIGVLSRKFHIPVYATCQTLRALQNVKSLGDLSKSDFYVIEPDRPFLVGDIKAEAFSIPHDAADPVSYTFESHGSKIGTVTDLGCYDDTIVSCLRDSDLLYIEANHDIRMLQAGPYPYPLKQRILGSRGHLCNEMTGKLIALLHSDHLKHVILGHLSKENNYPDLALETVLLEAFGGHSRQDCPDVFVAPRDSASALVSL